MTYRITAEDLRQIENAVQDARCGYNDGLDKVLGLIDRIRKSKSDTFAADQPLGDQPSISSQNGQQQPDN